MANNPYGYSPPPPPGAIYAPRPAIPATPNYKYTPRTPAGMPLPTTHPRLSINPMMDPKVRHERLAKVYIRIDLVVKVHNL